jgi:hypothetical protein
MKYSPLVMGIVLLFLSCQDQQGRKNSLSELIKGDWAAAPPKTEERQGRAFMSFDDSTCMVYWDNLSTYQIQNDTLIVKTPFTEKYSRKNTYAVLRLNSDSLFLLPLQIQTEELNPDTIKMYRVHTKNNIVPTTIYFSSSACFGNCPSMDFEIDSQRTMRFYGGLTAPDLGGHSGKVSEADYQSILSRIRLLPVDSLQEGYRAPWTDDQTRGMMIRYGNKLIRSAAYGHYQEPIELTILLNRLMSQYKRTALQPDSTVTYKYFETHPDTAHAVTTLVLLPQPEYQKLYGRHPAQQ